MKPVVSSKHGSALTAPAPGPIGMSDNYTLDDSSSLPQAPLSFQNSMFLESQSPFTNVVELVA